MELLQLRKLLNARDITGKEFAKAIGVTPNTASNLINNRSFPSANMLKAIADFLNLEVVELFKPSNKDTGETIYVQRDGKFTPIGQLKLY